MAWIQRGLASAWLDFGRVSVSLGSARLLSGVMYAWLGRGLAWLRLRLELLGVGVACLHRCFAPAWFGVGLASDQLRQNLLISRWVVPSTSPGSGAGSKGSR